MRIAVLSPRTALTGGLPMPVAELLGLSELNRTYERAISFNDGSPFPYTALRALDVGIDVDDEEVAHIPASGPTIIVANHPFGALDGLIAGALALRRRSDVRVLANEWLYRVPEIQPWLLGVDVFGDPKRRHTNASSLKLALRHLRSGGLLIMFPAGIVSHWQPEQLAVADPPWNRIAASLARMSNAMVVPMFFDGSNSWLFHAAGLIHSRLRTLLLPRELLQKRASRVRVRIGRCVCPKAMSALPNDDATTGWLRLRTYDLGQALRPTPIAAPLPSVPLIEAVPPASITEELASLDSSAVLVNQERYWVYLADSRDIPRSLTEIGRLRERTFREVGEGTGAPLDLDRFDKQYQHLILFDHRNHCIVGSYRIGFCDQLTRQAGPSGLYTNTLFYFSPGFVRTLGNTLELGRSFVRSEYQKSPLALALLWRGIGRVLVQNPRYEQLMGPVSISADYNDVSRRLMVSFLESLDNEKRRAKSVRARNRPRQRLAASEQAQLLTAGFGVRQLGRLIADADAKHQGIPVLLERYLELGGRVLSLNVDNAFGHCVDALVVVNVPRVPELMLKRFMGPDGLRSYLGARTQGFALTG